MTMTASAARTLNDVVEADVVGFVQRGIHLVEQYERRGAALKTARSRDRRHRLLTAGEEADRWAAPCRAVGQISMPLQHVAFVHKRQFGATAAEELLEQGREMLGDGLEGLQKRCCDSLLSLSASARMLPLARAQASGLRRKNQPLFQVLLPLMASS